jgi:NitT/TauT family transport system substrate-binding protein
VKRRPVLLLVPAGVAAALTLGLGPAAASPRAAATTHITLQLRGVPQAEFAGYYAAVKKGFYARQGLDVRIVSGSPDTSPEKVVAGGQAQFGVDWLSNMLAARGKGSDVVNVAQVFARSGMTQLTWKSSGITTVAGLRGKTVANWLNGTQYELFAALERHGMNPARNQGVTMVQQPFDMSVFLKHQVDSASALTYNELVQVLGSTNPKTGKLYTLSDLNVIKMQDAGTGMLEDGLFATGQWLANPGNRATAVKFIAASLQGWIFCRDHAAQCVDITIKAGSSPPSGQQAWAINEVNKLIWPSAGGVGIMTKADFNRTATISRQFGVIRKRPSRAYRTDLAQQALAKLKAAGLDVNGKSWKPAVAG